MSFEAYNNNTALKRKGVVIQYTPEQVTEIVRCQKDIEYFIRNYIYIISLDSGRIKFNLYDFQVELIKSCEDHRFNIFTIERQAGKTITISAYLLYKALFNRDYTVGILANNATKSREILSRVKMMYEELPWWLKSGVVKWNEGSIEFSNGSKMFAGPTTAASLRGYSINILYLDEFAFVQNDIQFYTSAYPVISSGNTTKIIITSTPNGMNLFYKLFTDAVNHRNSFAYKLFTWRDHPKKDEKWKIETIKNTSPKQFAQEHECRFLGSSNTLISGDCLERMVYADPIEQTESARLYKRVKPEAEYVACVDVSEGVGRDFSTVSVFDISVKPYEQVYVYQRNDISPWLLCGVVHEIARKYNSAYLVIENNSIGKIVADGVFYEYEYDNMVTTRMHKGSEKIEGYTLTDVGLVMNRKTKSIGCSAIKTLLEEGLLVVNDWATVQELGTFVKTGTSYQAEKNKFDDLVMPLIHFGWLTTQTWFEDLTSMGMRDLVKARNEKEAESRHLAFGFFSDGTDEISVTMM
jgi:hypothetical protein